MTDETNASWLPEKLPRIPLWPGDAPYSDRSPGQAQPSLQPYPAENARPSNWHFKRKSAEELYRFL